MKALSTEARRSLINLLKVEWFSSPLSAVCTVDGKAFATIRSRSGGNACSVQIHPDGPEKRSLGSYYEAHKYVMDLCMERALNDEA